MGPSNQCGGLNEKCYYDGTCNAGLNPTYDHLPGTALSYPVCYCRSNGYRLGATAGDDSSTKLGMPAPQFGREGEPCRSRNAPEGECDNGFYCDYTTDALRSTALANETSHFSLERARSAEPRPSGDNLRSVNGEPIARPSECLAVLTNPALPTFAPLGSDEEVTS